MAKSSPTSELDPVEWQELLRSTPEHLRDDCLSLFFRCEFSKRDRLLKCFNALHQERINGELERISKLRSFFTGHYNDVRHLHNVILLKHMTRARCAWRQVAKDRTPEVIIEVRHLEDEAGVKMKEKYRQDLIHLERLKDWELPPGLPRDPTWYVFSSFCLRWHILYIPLARSRVDNENVRNRMLIGKLIVVLKRTQVMGMPPMRSI